MHELETAQIGPNVTLEFHKDRPSVQVDRRYRALTEHTRTWKPRSIQHPQRFRLLAFLEALARSILISWLSVLDRI